MSVTFTPNQYLSFSNPLLTTKPISISAWIKTTDDVNNQGVVSITDNNDEFLLIQARMAVGGNPAFAGEYNTAWKYAESSTGITVSTWVHVLAVFKNDVSRTIYVNGGGAVTNTDSQSVNFNAIDRILIGAQKTSSSFFTGKIAEVAIWCEELSAANAVSLTTGSSPLGIGTVWQYWPLFDNASSGSGGSSLTESETLTYTSDSPAPIFNYPRSNLFNYKRMVVVGNNTFYYESI